MRNLLLCAYGLSDPYWTRIRVGDRNEHLEVKKMRTSEKELPRTRKLRGYRQCQDCAVCCIATGKTGAQCPKLERQAIHEFHGRNAVEEEASEFTLV